MQYQISGKQIDIGSALQQHVQDELGSAVAKYAERPTDAHVIFSKSASEFVCETIVHLSTGLTTQAKARAHVCGRGNFRRIIHTQRRQKAGIA